MFRLRLCIDNPEALAQGCFVFIFGGKWARLLSTSSFSFAQNYDYDLAPSTVLLVSLFTFVSAQFIYLINILIAFLRK
jgi:hypothetical protein